jgi:type IV pilus assembly protein PilA
MKKHLQQGFTLIELMIVVAIIGILAAIAIPAYQDYTIRSQVSEGAVLADGVKTAMVEYYNNKGAWPTSQASAGLESAASIGGKYVGSVDVAGTAGKIVVKFGTQTNTAFGNDVNAKIKDGTLTFSGVASSGQGSIAWTCAGDGTILVNKYLPQVCRN